MTHNKRYELIKLITLGMSRTVLIAARQSKCHASCNHSSCCNILQRWQFCRKPSGLPFYYKLPHILRNVIAKINPRISLDRINFVRKCRDRNVPDSIEFMLTTLDRMLLEHDDFTSRQKTSR